MENHKKITLTRIISASREELWKAWTVPEVLSKWWGPRGVTNPLCEVDLRVGGTIHIVMLAGKELGVLAGQHWPMKGAFKKIDQERSFVFANNAVDEKGRILIEGETTVLLEDSKTKAKAKAKPKNETKITVTTNAIGKVPEASQMIAGMEIGWNQSLDKLSELFS